MKKRRNNLSLFTNILLPYELYAVVTYRTYLPRLVWSSVLLAGILSLAFIVLGTLPAAHSEQRSAAGWKRQTVHSLLASRGRVARTESAAKAGRIGRGFEY